MPEIVVMHGRSELEAHDVELMQALRDEGMIAKEIAEKFECSIQQVWNNTKSMKKQYAGSMTLTTFRNTYQFDGGLLDDATPLIHSNKMIGVFVPENKLTEELKELLGI